MQEVPTPCERRERGAQCTANCARRPREGDIVAEDGYGRDERGGSFAGESNDRFELVERIATSDMAPLGEHRFLGRTERLEDPVVRKPPGFIRSADQKVP